jgi:hypothetical protein
MFDSKQFAMAEHWPAQYSMFNAYDGFHNCEASGCYFVIILQAQQGSIWLVPTSSLH